MYLFFGGECKIKNIRMGRIPPFWYWVERDNYTWIDMSRSSILPSTCASLRMTSGQRIAWSTDRPATTRGPSPFFAQRTEFGIVAEAGGFSLLRQLWTMKYIIILYYFMLLYYLIFYYIIFYYGILYYIWVHLIDYIILYFCCIILQYMILCYSLLYCIIYYYYIILYVSIIFYYIYICVFPIMQEQMMIICCIQQINPELHD